MFVFWVMDREVRLFPSRRRIRCSITAERVRVERTPPVEISIGDITDCEIEVGGKLKIPRVVRIITAGPPYGIALIPVNPIYPFAEYQNRDEINALFDVIQALRRGDRCEVIENPYLRQLAKMHREPPEGVILDPDESPWTYFKIFHPHFVRDNLIYSLAGIAITIAAILILAALFGGFNNTIP